ncbi:MAG: hypothetical protein WC374_00105 [Phycisphaerae bacterium]|jgi:hypothetical protein
MAKNSKFKTETLTKNESEKIFEQYLNSNGYQEKWAYEPTIPGKSKNPDYMLNFNNKNHFFEVKELREKLNTPKGAGHTNLYSSLRSEINEARKQFKEYKKFSCSLVVYNVDDGQAILAPLFVLSAMLGNLGFSTKFNTAEGTAVKGAGKNCFLGSGKMIDYKKKKPWNTTISTIIVLEDDFLDDSEYQRAIKEEMENKNRPLTGIEKFAIAEIESHHSTNVTRVVVVENPFARIAFPDGLFVGPFDERWKIQNDKIERVFAGDALREIEGLKSSNDKIQFLN